MLLYDSINNDLERKKCVEEVLDPFPMEHHWPFLVPTLQLADLL